jgi:hypothetical protein
VGWTGQCRLGLCIGPLSARNAAAAPAGGARCTAWERVAKQHGAWHTVAGSGRARGLGCLAIYRALGRAASCMPPRTGALPRSATRCRLRIYPSPTCACAGLPRSAAGGEHLRQQRCRQTHVALSPLGWPTTMHFPHALRTKPWPRPRTRPVRVVVVVVLWGGYFPCSASPFSLRVIGP